MSPTKGNRAVWFRKHLLDNATRGLHVDDQLNARGLVHRKVGGPLALEDAANIVSSQPPCVGEISSELIKPPPTANWQLME
jgi:hypothetical protein